LSKTQVKPFINFSYIFNFKIVTVVKYFKAFIIFISFISLESSCLQAQQLHFNTLTVNNGLSQHDPSSIVQDSYGFIWIGTYDGLNRFDGYNVKNFSSVYNDENSLSSNRIKSLFKDSKKRIWIGTDGSGLNYYSLKKNKFFRIKTTERYSTINCIVENSLGDILVGTQNGILKVKEGKTLSLELLQIPLTGVVIHNMVVAKDNALYIATNNGLWKLKGEKCEQQISLGNKNLLSIIFDKQYKLWVTSRNSIFVLDTNKKEQKPIEIALGPNINLSSLCLSKNNIVWVGTFNDGLIGIDPVNYTIVSTSKKDSNNNRGLLSNTILDVFCDKTNTLWVANRKGVCFSNLEEKKIKEIEIDKRKISDAHIVGLFVQDDDVFFGVQNDGFYRFSRKTKSTEKIQANEPLGNPLTVNKINGIIYLGTSNGVYTQKNNSLTFIKKNVETLHENAPSKAIYSICTDSFGTTYYGALNGLIVEYKDKMDWIHIINPQAELLRGKRIFNLYYDSKENCVWIGTISEGLFKMNLTADGRFFSLEIYSNTTRNDYFISNNSIWSFYKDSRDNLWVGTDSGLLYKPKSSNKFNLVTTESIKGKKIMGIQEDNAGNLWLNNSLGLFSYNVKSKKTFKYSYKDGLRTNTLTEASGKANDGTIFLGTIDGINFLNPDEIRSNPYKSNVLLTDFRVHGISIFPDTTYFDSKILENSINSTTEIVLNYMQNNFLFEFSSTNYSNPQKNKFRYRLEGYDKEWIYTTSDYRFATYSNLKRGTYKFSIDAANEDGNWSNEPIIIRIDIMPAPWLSIYAYILYVLIIISLIGIFIYFWNNKKELKHQIELDKIEIKKEQEINEFKLIFFTDIAHEFKTPLSLIIGPLNDLIENKHSKESVDFCYQILTRNTQRMMHLVNQLLDFRKVNADINILKVSKSDLSDLVSQTMKAFLWQAENENIKFNVSVPEEFVCFFDGDLIEKVLYNALSNAFKYTPKNGTIEINLKPIWNGDRQLANIIIVDSGKGISNKDKSKIFDRFFHGKERTSSGIGLHLSYKLITEHKGQINVSDSIYGGTEFIISFPVSKEDFTNKEIFKLKNEAIIAKKHEIEEKVENTEKVKNNESLETILIVEDDHDLRAYLRNSLQNDFQIFEATNGVEGLKQAQTKIPDIIISDVMMPQMDGVEMCTILKDDIRTSHIPLLMLTAKTDSHFKKNGLASGAWDYIAKPFNTRDLLQKIKNIIETRNNFKSYLIDQNLTIEVKKHYKSFDQKLISKVTTIINDKMQNSDFTVEELATEVGLSRMQLHRKLKTLVGQSTTKFINTIKINFAKKMIDEGCDRVQEVMDAVGFNSYSHFNTVFKEIVGKSPSNYIKDNNQNMDLKM
jgi:signal transduction histidine kinase/ligand-binding sensor domain-containing protein/DNA-binding response OmpR family regulator